jgi:hypothetical protein
MRLSELLDAIDLPKEETRFPRPPKGTCLIWLDEVVRGGADTLNCTSQHNVTFEIYSPDVPDPKAEQTIERLLDANAIKYFKYARQWLDEERLFMTAYDFSITEKDKP